MTRVLVAVGSAILRKGLEDLLAGHPGLEIVGGGSPDGIDWNQQVEELLPDVVVMEVAAHGNDSVPQLPAFASEARAPSMVVLADHPPISWTRGVLRSGVRAVLPRDAIGEEIVAAVEAAAAGLVVLDPNDFVSLVPATPNRSSGAAAAAQQSLTPCEIEVLQMLAEGLGNKEIAWRLGISEHTVKFHVNSIFTKLDASSRTEAVTIGIRQGLIMI